MIQWLASRVGVIYVIVFLFCLTCLDLRTLQMRVKVRHLNDAVPDFSDIVVFAKNPNAINAIDWKPYQKYFQLVLRYNPDDPIIKPLLGYVDFNMGQRQEALTLFKDSTAINGKFLLWSNYDLGVLYYKKGMWPQAADCFLKAIESNPQLNDMLMHESMVYKQIFMNPYYSYSNMDEIKDTQSRAFILLLSSLYSLKHYDKVLIVSALGLKTKNLLYKDAFYYYSGLAYLRMGEFNNALRQFQASLAIENQNPEVYYYLANMFERAGQDERAHELLKASIALHQKNDPRFPYDAQADLRIF